MRNRSWNFSPYPRHQAAAHDMGVIPVAGQLRLQARVLERQARRGSDCVEELWLVQKPRIVDEGCEPLAVTLEHGHGPVGVALGI